MRLVVLVLCLFSLSVPLLAETAPSEDDLKLTRLENQTHARDLYLAGDAASKKGDLQTAIWDWSQALKLKPDSAYTSKCLAQAREQLYKKYKATVSAKADTKDPLTAYVQASAMAPLLPDNKEVAERVDKLKNSLSDDQTKALAAYEDGQSALALQDYAKATSSFGTAQTFAREAACVKDAISRMDALRRNSPELFPATSAGGERLPQMVYIYVTWCHWCTKMNPVIDEVKAQHASKLSVIWIDGDKNPSAVQRYKVDGYPCMIFLDSKGAELGRIPGYVEKSEFMQVLDKLGV